MDVTEINHIECDIIYHLACPASPIYYRFNPVKTIKTNVFGTLRILELAREVKAKVLLTSTSEVYGDPEQHPQRESYWGNVNPIGPRSCYDEGKRCAEALVADFRQQNGIETRTVRIFNTYGPRMAIHDGRVVSNFIIHALKNQDISIYGNGEQTRSFCYVDDMIDGIISAMHSDYDMPINLGNPVETTINELAETIIKLTKSKSELKFKSALKDDPKRRCPDIALAQEVLRWQPTTQLIDGLEDTIKYFKGILSG